MFQVHANSLECYLSFDPERREDLDNLNALIRAAAPNLRRYFHQGTYAANVFKLCREIGKVFRRDPQNPVRYMQS